MDLFLALDILVRSNPDKKLKIQALQTIEQTLDNYSGEDDFNELLPFTTFVLIKTLQDDDMNIWSLAEQIVIKVMKHFYSHFDILIYEIWKAVKGGNIEYKDIHGRLFSTRLEGRSRRFALEAFAFYASSFKPKNDGFGHELLKSIVSIAKSEDQLLQETLAKTIGRLVEYYFYNSTIEDLRILIHTLAQNTISHHNKTRRSTVSTLVTLVHHIKHNDNVVEFILTHILSMVITHENPDKNIFQDIPQESFESTVQGVTHCFAQFLRMETHSVALQTFYLAAYRMVMGCFVHHQDHPNILVSGLELFDALIAHYDVTTSSLYSIDEVLENLGQVIFVENDLLISSKVQALFCLMTLSKYMDMSLQKFTQTNFTNILSLLQHKDPLLRGQGFLYIATFLKYWITCPRKIDWENLDVCRLLFVVLESIFKDDSSFVSKACCKGILKLIQTLLSSEYYAFVPYIIRYVLHFPDTTHKIVKSKIMSILSSVNYRILHYIEFYKPVSVFSSLIPTNSKLYDIPLQEQVIKVLVTFLGDSDPKLRMKASRALVHLIPNVNAQGLGEEHNLSAVQGILDLQTSLHKATLLNHSWAVPIDLIMNQIYPLMNQHISEHYFKGFHTFLRHLLESGYEITPGFAPIILEQVLTHSSISDLESQLDILILLGFSTSCMNANYLKYIHQIFDHCSVVLHILHRILKRNRSISGAKAPYALAPGDFLEHPYYRLLFEKLEDVYSLSLSTYDNSIFDEFCVHAFKSLERMMPYVGKLPMELVDDLFTITQEFFHRYTEECLDFLDELLYLVHDGLYPTTTNLYGMNPLKTGTLNPSLDPSIPSSSLYEANWIDVYRQDKTFGLVYGYKEQMYQTQEREWRRSYSPPIPSKNVFDFVKKFEPIANECLDIYSIAQSRALKGKLLNFISKLGGYGVHCVSSDMNSYFLKHIHDRLLRTLKNVFSTQPYMYDEFKSELFSQDILIPTIALSFELYIRRKLPPPGSLKLRYRDFMNMIDGIFEAEWYKDENLEPMKTIIFVLFEPMEDASMCYQGLEIEMQKLNMEEDVMNENGLDMRSMICLKEHFVNNLSKNLGHPKALLYLKLLDDFDHHISKEVNMKYYHRMLDGYRSMMSSSQMTVRKSFSSMSILEIHNHFSIIDKLPSEVIHGNTFVPYILEKVTDDAIWLPRTIVLLRLLTNCNGWDDSWIESTSEYFISSLIRVEKILKTSNCNEHVTRKACLFIHCLYRFVKRHNSMQAVMKSVLDKEGSKTWIQAYESSTYSSLLFSTIPLLKLLNQTLLLQKVHDHLASNPYTLRYWHWGFLRNTLIHTFIEGTTNILKPYHLEWMMMHFSDKRSLSFIQSLNESDQQVWVQTIRDRVQRSRLLREENDTKDIPVDPLKSLDPFQPPIASKDLYNSNISSKSLLWSDEMTLLSYLTVLEPTDEIMNLIVQLFLSSRHLCVVISLERVLLKWIQTLSEDFKEKLLKSLKTSNVSLRKVFVKKVEGLLDRSLELPEDTTLYEKSVKLIQYVRDPFVHASTSITLLLEVLDENISKAVSFSKSLNDPFWNVITEEFKDMAEAKTFDESLFITGWIQARSSMFAITSSLTKLRKTIELENPSILKLMPRKLLCLANFNMKLLLQIYETYQNISDVDITDTLSLIQYLLKNEGKHIQEDDQVHLLIRSLYMLSVHLFGLRNQHFLSRTEPETIPQIFETFYDIFLYRRFGEYNVAQSLFCDIVGQLSHISSEIESSFFPNREPIINFDTMDDPVSVLINYNYVINASPPIHPEAFVSVWNQLYRGIDPSSDVHPDATSPTIKALSIRALTNLLLRVGYRQLKKEDYKFLGIPLLRISDMQKNVTYTMKKLNVSNLLRDFISIIKENVEAYSRYTTTEPFVGKESLRCIILLSELFNTTMRVFVQDPIVLYLENEFAYMEDPIISNYLLLGIGKFIAISWPVIQTSKDRSRYVFKRIHELLYHHFATLGPLRMSAFSEETPMTLPVSKTMFLITLNYLLQAKTILINSNTNEMMFLWLRAFLNSKLASLSLESLTDTKILESTKTSSPLMKYLAFDCTQVIQTMEKKM